MFSHSHSVPVIKYRHERLRRHHAQDDKHLKFPLKTLFGMKYLSTSLVPEKVIERTLRKNRKATPIEVIATREGQRRMDL